MRIAASWPRSPPLPPPDMSGPELVFLHIPKTAGTSQQNAFKEYYGSANIFWIGKDCPPDIWRYPRAKVGERFVVGGHKRLSFYPRDLDPLYCAILRDPVERAISLFGYYTRPDLAISERDERVRAGLLQKMLAKGIDPDSMLNSIRNCRPFRREISNYQCKYLSRGRATFAAVRNSLEHHDFAIGTVGCYDRFHRELWDILDWVDEAPQKVNRSRDDYAAAYLDDKELVAAISQLNREDDKLVNWVESEQQGLWLRFRDVHQRRRRLRRLPIRAGRRKARQWAWADAPDLWPPREGPSPLIWPLSRLMVAEPHRLTYMPTPGAANQALQRMMLDLSDVPHPQAILELGIERVVEQFVTGLVLEDRSAADIRSIAQAQDYYRFAILYEPLTRLVNLYQQRFVAMREQLPQWPQLLALVAETQGLATADCGRGISFRELVLAIVSEKYRHPLLLTQTRYLPWSHSYNRFYRPDQLPELAADIARLRGISVDPGQLSAEDLRTVQLAGGRYADTPAGELPADPAQWRDQLVDDALLEVIKGYYAMDFKLYNQVAEQDVEEADA